METRIKRVKRLLKEEYASIRNDLRVSNKDGFDDGYVKGLKEGFRIALEIVKE